jgi:small subunit ribosomal protein S1
VRDTATSKASRSNSVIRLDQKRNNVVVSRRAVVGRNSPPSAAHAHGNLQEGTVLRGTVKNLTDYGAFVDLVASTACCLTDMAWKASSIRRRVKSATSRRPHPQVRPRAFTRIARPNSWARIRGRTSRDAIRRTRVFGKVTNIAGFGAF